MGCEELTHWKRPWCWERLKAGEGDNRGWDGWMASLTRWTWVWASSGSDGQGGLACCSPWGHEESDIMEQLNWTEEEKEYKILRLLFFITNPWLWALIYIIHQIPHERGAGSQFWGKNTRVGYHVLLRGIFPTQGWNPCLAHFLHWQMSSLPLTPARKPLEAWEYCVLPFHRLRVKTTFLFSSKFCLCIFLFNFGGQRQPRFWLQQSFLPHKVVVRRSSYNF